MTLTTLQPFENPHAPGCPWHEMAAMFGGPNIKWCEETICHWISEPANTLSNVAYLIVAFGIWRGAKGKTKIKHLAVAIALMGIFSAVYHASNFSLTQLADFVGMFIALGFLLGMSCSSLWPGQHLSPMRFSFRVVIFFTPVSVVMYVFQWPAQILIMILGGTLAALEITHVLKTKLRIRELAAACLFAILAAAATFVDHRRILCIPGHHVIQGHALWHVFSATALWFLSKRHSVLSAVGKSDV
jgi:hypothetical protein